MWIAAVQLTSTAQVDRNLSRARGFIIQAAKGGADLVALPENFAYMGPELDTPPSAQPLQGPLVQEFGELAKELGIFLLLGSFPETTEPDKPPYNTSVLLGPDGAILAVYRKIHLFDVDLARGPGIPGSSGRQRGGHRPPSRHSLHGRAHHLL